MWNYEHEVVLNTIDDTKTKVVDGVAIIEREGNYVLDKVYSTIGEDGTETPTQGKCTKIAYRAAANGVYGVTLDTVTAPDYARLAFKITSTKEYGEFAQANWSAGALPVIIEYTDAASFVAGFKAAVPADIAVIKEDGSEITFAEPCFAIDLASVNATKMTPSADPCCQESPVEEAGTAAFTVTTAPDEGVGTYDYIVNNMRMVTYENARYAGVPGELPMKNGKYDIYVFDYVVERELLGGMSAASQFVTSKTHHVFYVEQNAGTFPIPAA